MSFNAAATRLAVSSSNRTIHIFDVSNGQGGSGSGSSGSGGGSGGGGGGGVERGRSRRRSNTSARLVAGGGSGASGGGQGHEGNNADDIGGDAGAGASASAGAVRRRGTGDGRGTETGAGSAGGGLVSGFRSVVGLLPNRVTKRVQDYVDSNRSFASVRLRGGTGRSICALIPAGESGAWVNSRGGARAGGPGEEKGRSAAGGGNDSRQGEGEGEEEEEEEGEILLVVTNEGILYSYAVDTIRGGECRLEQASSLLLDPSASQEIGSELFVPERRAPPVLAGQG